jgi:hypothetical protein
MKYNPYTLLTPEILSAMLRQPMYFIRQHYARGLREENELSAGDSGKTVALLLTHYIHQEADRERADRHLRLLTKDTYRFFYDSTIPEHFEKLKTAATQPGRYQVYINLLPRKWKATDGLKAKINRYMKRKLSWWNYSPADKLQVTLKERYGELFIVLLWKGQQTEVLLEDIENFSVCATT